MHTGSLRAFFGVPIFWCLPIVLVACSASSSDGDVDEIGQAVQLPSAHFSLELQTPVNVAAVDVALAATDSLELEAASQVVGRGGTRAIVSNTGAAGTKIDLEARAGDVYSKSKVTLGPDSHLTGNLFALSLDKQRSARVDGTTTTPAMLDPLQTQTFKVEFPSASAKSLTLHGYRTRELTPGRFGTVSVSGHLVLDSGSYYFDSLSVVEGASIDLSQHDGPTLIFIKDNCYFAGDLRRLTKQSDLAIIDVSDHDLFVPNSFRGVIAAPRAHITLGSLHDAAHPAHGNGGLWHLGVRLKGQPLGGRPRRRLSGRPRSCRQFARSCTVR
jgi:hypothetical protein